MEDRENIEWKKKQLVNNSRTSLSSFIETICYCPSRNHRTNIPGNHRLGSQTKPSGQSDTGDLSMTVASAHISHLPSLDPVWRTLSVMAGTDLEAAASF